MTLKETVKAIERECFAGRITPPEAITQIDTAIGGITSAEFQTGLRFKIINHNAMFSLRYEGLSKKKMARVYGIAVYAYMKAQENGNIEPGEVHISRGASTKHHMDGIHDIAEMYAEA